MERTREKAVSQLNTRDAGYAIINITHITLVCMAAVIIIRGLFLTRCGLQSEFSEL